MPFYSAPARVSPPSIVPPAARRVFPYSKRAAGGAVVLADRGLLGLDIVLPAGDPLLLTDLTQSYRWLGEAWVAALDRCGGLATAVAGESAARHARAG